MQVSLVAIYVVALALRLPLLLQPLTIGVDAWRQADTASIAHHFLRNGYHLLYPQIYWGGSGPGYVETEFQLYPFLVATVYGLFGERAIWGRVLSLVLAIPTVALMHRLCKLVLPSRGALIALLVFALSPLYLRYSVAFMPESTEMLFYVLSLYLLVLWLRSGNTLHLVLSAAATALAILVKPTAIHIGLVALLLMLHRHGLAIFGHPGPWAYALVSLLPEGLFYLHARGLYQRFGNTFGVLSGGDTKFGSFREWFSREFYVSILRLEATWLLGAGGAILCLCGLWMSIQKKRPLVVPIGVFTIGIYYFIVARYAMESWGVHYHLYALPYYALSAGLGAEWLLQKQTRIGKVMVSVLLVAFALHVAVRYRELVRAKALPLSNCARTLAEQVPRHMLVAVVSKSPAIDEGRPNNFQNPILFYLADRYGWSIARDQFTVETLERLKAQGAQVLVQPYPEVQREHPEVSAYLRTHAEPIGNGLSQECTIHRFLPPVLGKE